MDESLSGICIGEACSWIKELVLPIGEAGFYSHETNCSSSGFKSNSISNSNSNSNSSPKPNPKLNPKPNPTYASIKIDITNKVCNKCKVIIQITSFDKKKSICKKCNSKKINCEYFSSIFSLSGLRSHIKNSHKVIDLAKGVKEEPEYYKYYNTVSKLKAKGIDIDTLLEE